MSKNQNPQSINGLYFILMFVIILYSVLFTIVRIPSYFEFPFWGEVFLFVAFVGGIILARERRYFSNRKNHYKGTRIMFIMLLWVGSIFAYDGSFASRWLLGKVYCSSSQSFVTDYFIAHCVEEGQAPVRLRNLGIMFGLANMPFNILFATLGYWFYKLIFWRQPTIDNAKPRASFK